MKQLTIYLDSDTEKRIREAARSARMSLSKWVACLVREKTRNVWPDEVAKLAGKWSEFPSSEDLRSSMVADHPREPLT